MLEFVKGKNLKKYNIAFRTPILAAAVWASAGIAGPISKFENDKPDIETVSTIGLFDLERCLTDMDGWPVPFIYRQPDRPEETNILWVINAKTVGRAYLKRVASGVAVKIWNADGNQTKSCVGTGKPR